MTQPITSLDPDAFAARHAAYLDRIDAGIDLWLPAATTRPERLHRAMRYAVSDGGKRLRPVLLLAVYDMHPSAADPIPAAVALECVHSYSLVHDDLPCMDDSDLRRGRPACHREFDEATAVLAGDALLTEAFQILGRAYAPEPERCTALICELSAAAGSRKLIAGQAEDTLGEGTRLGAADLHYIQANKTAALIAASLVMAVLVSDAPPGSTERARAVGHRLGLAFQIVDDILDATGNAQTLGKSAGADSARGKNTSVSIHGLDASRDQATRLSREARDTCAGWDADTGFLRALITSMENRIR